MERVLKKYSEVEAEVEAWRLFAMNHSITVDDNALYSVLNLF